MSVKYKFLNRDAIYFITFSTIKWIDIFTRLEYKQIFCDSIKYCQEHKGLVLYCWCLMTNHVHMIFGCNDSLDHSAIIRDLKKYTSRQLIMAIQNNPKESRKKWLLQFMNAAGLENSNNVKYQLWQQDNHPIELYSPKVCGQKLNYIHNNPVVAGFVSEPEDYLFSSARNYQGKQGVLDVEILNFPNSMVGFVVN